MRQRFQCNIGLSVVTECRIETLAECVLFALETFGSLFGNEQRNLVTFLVAHEIQQIRKDIDECLFVCNFVRIKTWLHLYSKIGHAIDGGRTTATVSA